MRGVMGSGPEGSRTPNLLIRSQMLYPVKLRVLLGLPFGSPSVTGLQKYELFEISKLQEPVL